MHKDSNVLLFFTGESVFKFYYKDESKDIEIIYKIDNSFEEFPQIGTWNLDQTKFILTSEQNILYVDMSDKNKLVEIDLDDREVIS